MSLLLVLFWSSLVVKVSSNYRVVENTPDKPCTLATPEIEFGDLPNRVILDGDSLPDTLQEARVGYVKALVELQYIGCIPLSDISGINHVSVWTSRNVSQCYSACGDDYAIIGLTSRDSDSPCLCFGDDIKSRTDRLNDCNTKCGAFVCGSHGSVSIYEKVKVELATGQHSYRSDSCLTVSVDGYNWKKCDGKLCHVACFTDNDETKYFSLSKYVCVWPLLDSWSNGVRQCFADSKYPITYQQSSSVDWKEQHWTGVIQTIAIRKSIGDESRHVKAFGYVKKSDDGYILNFNENLNSIVHSICVDEMVSSSTDKPGTSQSPEILSTSPSASTYADTTPPLRSSHTSTSTTITPENTSIADTSTANLITTTTTKITTAMSTENKHMTESMASPNGDKTEEESNVGLSIGLPVAALLLVGIGVVVFVLWNRRRPPLEEKKTRSSLHNDVIYQNNTVMIAQTHSTYEEVDKPSDVPNDQANVYDLCKDDDKDSQHEYEHLHFGLENAKDAVEYSEVTEARE